jgi:hypothetical protein
MKRQLQVGIPTQSAINDAWQRRATAAAIKAARSVVGTEGAIPSGTPIGRLSETEWGWIVAAVLFGWIKTRAEQAAAEELDTEQTIRLAGLDPEPWDCGAVSAILPELAETPGIDWSKPIGAWPQDVVINFLLIAMRLIRKAQIARDRSERGVTQKSSASTIARQANAAAGGPLLAPDELNDEIDI